MKSDITSFSKANKSRDVKFIIAISKNPQVLPLQKPTSSYHSKNWPPLSHQATSKKIIFQTLFPRYC